MPHNNNFWKMLAVLRWIPSGGRGIDTNTIVMKFASTHVTITNSHVLRYIKDLINSGFEIEQVGSKNHSKWCFKQGAKNLIQIPEMDHVGALFFGMIKSFLSNQLPDELLKLYQASFSHADEILEELDNTTKNWQDKIRIADRSQSLLPPKVNASVLNAVTNGLITEHQVSLDYLKRGAKQADNHIANPLGLVLRGHGILTLVCTIGDNDKPVQLHIHRIEQAKVLASPILPIDFCLDDYINSGQMEINKGASFILKAQLYNGVDFHLHETPLSHDQTLKESPDGSFLITATVTNTSQLRWWLLGFGKNIQVFEPDFLRKELANHARSMLEHYDSPTTLTSSPQESNPVVINEQFNENDTYIEVDGQPEVETSHQYKLSKWLIMAGRQCNKRLFMELHKAAAKSLSASAKNQLEVGTLVGETAQTLWPAGILIDYEKDTEAMVNRTKALLIGTQDITLFEATFQYHGVVVRLDVLVRKNNSYHMIEVKAATKVYHHYLDDCAIQTWVVEGSGITLDSIELGYVNNAFSYRDDSNYQDWLKLSDITSKVNKRKAQVPAWIRECRTVLAGKTPRTRAGAHCSAPYSCPFHSHCNKPVEGYPVTLFPRDKKVAEALLKKKITDIRDIPENTLKKLKFERMRVSIITGKAYINPDFVNILKKLAYPRYYLDFETVQFAVPIWKDTRPYQNLPFQYSVHIEQFNGERSHESFLDTSGSDPTRALAEQLLKTLGTTGHILVYSSFESTTLKYLIKHFPDLAPALRALNRRLVDLYPYMQEHYYHRKMMGSWSLKVVAPSISSENDYSQLNIQDGRAAQRAYLELINPDVSDSRRIELIDQLKRYCALDTFSLMESVSVLSQMQP